MGKEEKLDREQCRKDDILDSVGCSNIEDFSRDCQKLPVEWWETENSEILLAASR